MGVMARSLVRSVAILTSLAAAPLAAQTRPSPAAPPGQIVDSILPPAEELSRFQRAIAGSPPRVLTGARTRDELIQRFVRGLETRDTSSLVSLILSKAEFGYLFFPGSEYARPPYRQKPGLVWFRMTATSERGLRRLLARDAGRPLGYLGHRCGRPLPEGRGTIWKDCVVMVRRDGRTVERKLFGSILERDGRFKFLTYSTEY